MSGFLLAEDAVSARKLQFDNWVDEQRRNAERAAQQVQQAAQAAAQQQTAEAAARAQQFQDWVSQQQQPSAPAAPAAPPQPAAAAVTQPPPAAGPDPDVQARARQFQDWITQQQQPSPATQPTVPVSPFAETPTPPTTQAAALPHAEEPATASDALGGKWKTNFDFGATYTGNYRTGTPHRGVDLVPNQGGIGTPVEAFAPGTVTNISRDSGAGGLMVYVQDDQGLTHTYMHLASAAPGLQVGQRVNRGDPIATMGESGTEGAPHLHYEVRKNASVGDPIDRLIDPRPYVAGTGGGQRAPAGAMPDVQIDSSSPEAFVRSITPAALWVAQRSGIPPAAMIAMAANETGYGKYAPGNNLFGIKGEGPAGSTTSPTWEDYGQGPVNIVDKFRRYTNVAQSFQDFVDFLRDNPRYRDVMNLVGQGQATVTSFVQGLKDAGYMTDPNYVGKIQSIVNTWQPTIDQVGPTARAARTGAVEGVLEAGRQVATRAADLATQGQQLVDRSAQGARDAWAQFDTMQAQTRANTDRWLAEQRQRMETQATERQQQGLEFQRTLDEQRRQFEQNAEPLNRPPLEGFTAPGGPAEAFTAPGGPVGQAFEQLGTAINPSFGTQADVERRVQERLAEQGQAEPQAPGFGDIARAVGLVGGGPASLRGQAPREVRQRLDEDVARFVREQVPGGDNPVAGPLMTMIGQELTHPENYLLAGPLMQLGRGTAATLGLSGTRGAMLDFAVQGGVFSAVAEASKPGATPESVGQAFVTGAGITGALPGVGALLAPIGRRFLRSPQVGELGELLRTRQPAQAEVGFAAGLPRRPGVEPEVPSTRMFHGTVEDFPTARTDLPASEGENMLGPGYYLTPDPEHAGLYARRPTGYYGERAGTEIGANVRAVDVPGDLKLFDLQAPRAMDPTELNAVVRAIRPLDAERANTLEQIAQATREGQLTGRMTSPQAIWDYLTTGPRPFSVTEANRIIDQAGFDGIRGRTFAEGTAIFEPAVSKLRNAVSGRQGGQIEAQLAARLGGAVAGGVTGWQTTPEEAQGSGIKIGDVELPSVERVGRTLGGVGIGLAAPGVAEAAIKRPQLDQTMLESLRRGGITVGPPAPGTSRSRAGVAFDMTKQGILTDPIGRIMDMVGNTIELVRQPVALTMGGRGQEAAAGVTALTRAIPEAFQNTRLALQGMTVPTLGQGAQWTGRSGPIFRVMAAADMFTRTLGEYQGMAARAFQMLEEAGLKPGTAQADQYLAQHADELYREGARSGVSTVFGQSKQAGQQSSQLDKLMAGFSTYKESLLNSSSKKEQALGALLDLEIPFSGTPSRVLQIAIQRVPGITQAVGVARIAKALEKGDTFGAQKAMGELTLESMIQAQIAQGIREGNITGPDDPEHPSSVQVPGVGWVPMRRFGVYGTPMAIMAAFAEGWEKAGRAPDPEISDQFAAALNASMEPLIQGVPGFTLLSTVAGLGRGGLTRATTGMGSDIVERFTPAVLASAENMVDPFVRDIATRGPQQLWEPAQGRIPGLAHFLPPKIDPTTGEPRQRGFSVLGGATKPSSAFTAELARLERKGYTLKPPSDKPSSVTINGIPVPVKDGSPEQRAMVKARGQLLGEISQQMQAPSYARMTDDQKAQMWNSLIDRSAKVQAGAWLETVDPATAGRILSRGRPIAGRLQDLDETERINQQVALTNQMRRQQREMARA